MNNEHVLYTQNDADAPEQIKDRNGDVVLDQCRICGKGEIDLDEPCVPIGIKVGQEVVCKDTPDIVGTVMFVGKKHALLEGDDGEEWVIYIDSLEPVKTEAENYHRVLIGKIINLHLDVNNDEVNGMSKTLYEEGCRVTRELTSDVIGDIWFDTKKGDGFAERFARAIAAYVTGVDE